MKQLLLLVSLFTISACNPVKWLAGDEYLLVKNKLRKIHSEPVTHGANLKIEKRELAGYIKQKPNRKILGIARFNLAVYNYAGRKHKHPKDSLRAGTSHSKKPGEEDEHMKDKLKNIVGEPPVILDTSLTKRSSRQIKLYLNSKGYFNSFVDDSTVYSRNPARKRSGSGSQKSGVGGGKAKVYYLINPGLSRYTIGKVAYSIKDPAINSIVLSEKYSGANSLLKTGNYYDEETLNAERERITRILKNEGYYYFAKEDISYTADSALAPQQVWITLNIKNPKKQVSPDSVIETNHNRYSIGNVYVETNYNSKRTNIQADTLLFNDYFFIGISPGMFKNATITRKLFINKNSLFQINNMENTYKHLAGLQVFKFINIRFNDISVVNERLLDCIIQLTPMPRQSFSIETEGTHSSGNLGLAGNIVYRNKNVFKGAEIFELRLKGALEAQKTLVEPESKPGESLFNTLEIGSEAKLHFPKFFFPVRVEKIPKRFDPKTIFTTAYNYQKRDGEYTRTISRISFGYDWNETVYKTHILNPVEINLVKIDKEEKFEDVIKQINNPFIENSFIDHFTTAFKYSFIFNTQQLNKNINFTYLRANLELAGNMLNGFNTLAKVEPDPIDSSYHLLNIRYAQYVRSDIDLRYYHIFNKHNTIVFRAAMGIGIPYGNSIALPFEKNFFAGGANGIRAWKARTLGPGSLDTKTIQLADAKLEGNLEYRFDITKIFQGAAFIDAGNIWLLREDSLRPGANFQTNRFISEIAIGAGLGLRLNFTFFVVRLDAAIPLKIPSLEPGNRWFTEFSTDFKKDVVYNLGIGYPF